MLPNRNAFDRFLAALDPDPNRAGELYEKTRSMLITFFRGRDCWECDDLADETFERVGRRLNEVDVQNLKSFILGVARVVASEAHKKGKKTSSIEETHESRWIERHPEQDSTWDQTASEDQLRCLEECRKTLSDRDDYLIREYYQYGGRPKIDRRQKLAEEFGIDASALRVKAFRVRKQLQKCVLACLRKSNFATKR